MKANSTGRAFSRCFDMNSEIDNSLEDCVTRVKLKDAESASRCPSHNSDLKRIYRVRGNMGMSETEHANVPSGSINGKKIRHAICMQHML